MIKAKEFMFVTILIVVCVFISSIEAKRLEYPWRRDLGNGCNSRFPSPACRLRIPANPYTRGCTKANRCRREASVGKSSLKKLWDKVLADAAYLIELM
ncbi:PREDICTED: protein RALF-like 29 [Camelina sativa]|uniref:Protein RALF-like 29 n=1 Tax=Camelina sativa TaxID=90675 RepID=A0ABM1QD63_CAMSA|nr:PREDICTED: protein RALF-like 29 [Camelina sativa]